MKIPITLGKITNIELGNHESEQRIFCIYQLFQFG